MAKGIVIFYVNVNMEHMEHVKPHELIDMARENHIEAISAWKEKGWDMIFMPCIGEASRIEKIDLIGGEDDNDN
jgi:hypothetical protein